MHLDPITFTKYKDLKDRQKVFIDALIDDGASGYTLTRKQLVATAERCGYPGNFPWPSWITADMSRRIDRGIFSVPELGDRVNERANSPGVSPGNNCSELPETMQYIGNGLMAPDMTFSALCYNDGIDAVESLFEETETIVDATTEVESVSPGHETENDGLGDFVEDDPQADLDLQMENELSFSQA